MPQDLVPPLLAAAQGLFAGSLSHCLSYRFLPGKEKALAQRCRQMMDRALCPSERSSLPAAETALPRGMEGTGEPAQSSDGDRSRGAPWLPLSYAGTPRQPNSQQGEHPEGTRHVFVSPWASGLAEDWPGIAALSLRLLGMRLTRLLCIPCSCRRRGEEL